jgi:hypothetical protein
MERVPQKLNLSSSPGIHVLLVYGVPREYLILTFWRAILPWPNQPQKPDSVQVL